MKVSLILCILVFLAAGCQNMNVAWRGQVTVYSTTNKAELEGKVVNTPHFREGSKSIMAPKEYSDFFNPNTKVNSAETDERTEAPLRTEHPKKTENVYREDNGAPDLLDIETIQKDKQPKREDAMK